MQIETWALAGCNPAPYNPRKDLKPGDPEYERLKKSIQAFDYIDPIIVNRRTARIVGGHQRYKILRELGYTEAVVSVVDLDETQEKALNVALNKTGGTWDEEALASLLEELTASLDDIEVTGFSADEAADLLAQFETLPQEDPDAELPEVPSEPITQPGDLWQLGRHRLLCGDSTNAEDIARLMDGRQADGCFTSPPYLAQRTYDGHMASDWYALVLEVFTVAPLAPEAQVFVNLGLVHRDGRVIRYWDPFLAYMEEHEWPLFGWYVWDKLDGMPGDWNGRLAPAHEWIFHFTRRPLRALKTVESKRAGERPGRTQRNADGTLKRFTGEGKAIQSHKIPDSVVRVGPQKPDPLINKHPAPFPVALPRVFLDAYPAELWYEPFSGSGTTIAAAEECGQTVYGMELNPAYCDVIIARWEALTGQKGVKIDATRTPE